MTHISATEGIVPIEEAQKELPRLLAQLGASDEAIVITKDGRAAGILLSPQAWDALQVDQAFIAAVDESLATLDTDAGVEGEQVRAWLRSIGKPNEIPAPE